MDSGNEISVFDDNILRGLLKSCGCKKNVSNPEYSLLELLNSFSPHKFSKSKILDVKEIDLYNDELKLGIEYSGKMYERLGFKYLGQASISYYWYLRCKKLKREQRQVKKLKELYPELYNQSAGTCKIYTAGNTICEFLIRKEECKCHHTQLHR